MDAPNAYHSAKSTCRNENMEELLGFLVDRTLPVKFLQVIYVSNTNLSPRKWFFTGPDKVLKLRPSESLTSLNMLSELLAGSMHKPSEGLKRKVCYLIKQGSYERELLSTRQLKRLLLPNLMIVSEDIHGFQQYVEDCFTLKCEVRLRTYPIYEIKPIFPKTDKLKMKAVSVTRQLLDMLNENEDTKLVSSTFVYLVDNESIKMYLLDIASTKVISFNGGYQKSRVITAVENIVKRPTQIRPVSTIPTHRMMVTGDKRGHPQQEIRATHPRIRSKTPLRNAPSRQCMGLYNTLSVRPCTGRPITPQKAVSSVIKVVINVPVPHKNTLYTEKANPVTYREPPRSNTSVNSHIFCKHFYTPEKRRRKHEHKRTGNLLGLYLQATKAKTCTKFCGSRSSARLTKSIREEIRTQLLLGSKNDSKSFIV